MTPIFSNAQNRPTQCLLACLFLAAAMVIGCGDLLAQQVPRAEVVEDEAPRLVVPRAVPVGPDGQPLRAQVVEDAAAPKGPDEDLFSYGTMLYERGEYDLALKTYQTYTQSHPSGRHMATVLFRLGECLVKLNRELESRRFYEDVVNRFPKSEGAPPAAYRLGAMSFNNRDFQSSVRYFSFCEKNSAVPQVRLAAAYNLSRAYQMLGQTEQQMAALGRVANEKTNNPYREQALLTLARSEMGADSLESGLKHFEDLIATGKDEKLRAEAIVNSAVLLGELKRPEEALKRFEEALAHPETSPDSRAIALVGVVQALYDKGDYEAVIDNYNRNASVLPPGKTRGKMLLLVGNAYRMKKTYSRAVEIYLMVEQDYPQEDVAFEAGYWKLYCFYLLDDKDLGEFANGFLKRWAKTKEGHEFIAKAALIRADFFFNRTEYAEAAQAFTDVAMDDLPDNLRANALFNMGYAMMEAGRYQEAVSAFTRFLNENPNHELAGNALANRGINYRSVKDFASAKEDFKKVTEEYGKGPSAEMAWYQLGLIAATERDPLERIRAFENLVKLFPQSQAVPQAWFGIGSSAFEREDWGKAQEALRRAIRLDAENYLDSGNQMLMLSYYAQEDAEGLAKAIDEYLEKNANAILPPNMLGWLGLKLFVDQDYKRAAKYLSLAVTPEEPANTQPALWNYLGMAQVETGDFKPAVIALNHYLDTNPNPGADRGKALLFRARAELGAGKHTQAVATADEALGFIKAGRLQAELLILEGDILFDRASKLEAEGKTQAALNDYRAAAGKYIVPSQFFVDPKITPEAVWKTILALEKSGEKDRAGILRKELQEKYPSYRPPTDTVAAP